jgi:anti-anti-sigma factor
MLQARFEETSGALLVTPLARELDAEAAPRLREVVGERARGRKLVVLSLDHVANVDCSALAVLVAVLKRMAPDGELRLAGVSAPVRALLAATHLDEVFAVFDDPGEALQP